jgi:hypothetical protein
LIRYKEVIAAQLTRAALIDAAQVSSFKHQRSHEYGRVDVLVRAFIDQCTNNAIRIMMGIGTPSSSKSKDRMVISLTKIKWLFV